MPARGGRVKPRKAIPRWCRDVVGSALSASGSWMRTLRLPEFFSGERFSDGVAVRFADVTTCYPGQAFLRTAAHDGIVRNRHKAGKRARP